MVAELRWNIAVEYVVLIEPHTTESGKTTMSKKLSRWTLGLAILMSSVSMARAEDLTIGSKAPKLDIEHWVSNGHDKFKPVQKFEAGKVYVVEFWATWCGPCVMSMPHLAATQEKYADKGVQLISVSDEDLDTVEGFLEKPVRGAAKDDSENTYAKLTSAYCLTTDPDKSVYEDYMDAAGQNGIPTCFIVGKTGLIEWIGHPMQMDEPLDQLVEDKWDREVYLAEFKKKQQFDLLMAKVSRPMQTGNVKAALKILAKAREEAAGDESTVAQIDDLELRINMFSITNKINDGEVESALEEIEKMSETAKPAQKQQLALAKCKALIGVVADSGKMDEQAAKALTEISESADIPANSLNELAWTVYEAAADNKKFSKPLIAAATLAAEKAVAKEPDNGAILDTLAHLVYIQGNVERAIELQTKAVKNAPEQMKDDLQSFLDELQSKKSPK